MSATKVRIGTDCSGTDGPVIALRGTEVCTAGRIRISHKFSCDSCPSAREFIRANHKPKFIYDDILNRDHSKVPPVDVYVVGWPCQPWSMLGLKKGFADKRASVYKSVIKTLKKGKIKSFVLENVGALASHEGGKSLERVLSDLRSSGYSVQCKKYMTSDFGIPQKRPRLYFMGVHNSVGKVPRMPSPPRSAVRPLSDLLDDERGPRNARPAADRQGTCCRNLRMALKRLKKHGVDPARETWAIDVDPGASRRRPPSLVHLGAMRLPGAEG